MAEMMFRVQKLLRSEYEDFNEEVLIETPFTEVTDDGIGKRQLYIGKFIDLTCDACILQNAFQV